MPSVTSNSPWTAVSWLCRHKLGWTVSGQSPATVRVNASASYTTRPSAPLITPGSSRATRPRLAFSKSVRLAKSAGILGNSPVSPSKAAHPGYELRSHASPRTGDGRFEGGGGRRRQPVRGRSPGSARGDFCQAEYTVHEAAWPHSLSHRRRSGAHDAGCHARRHRDGQVSQEPALAQGDDPEPLPGFQSRPGDRRDVN